MELVIVMIIGGAAAAAIILPLLRPDAGSQGSLDEEPGIMPIIDVEEVEREISRYRAALRAGTLCPRCAQANPDRSRYCFECGRRLEQLAVPPAEPHATP